MSNVEGMGPHSPRLAALRSEAEKQVSFAEAHSISSLAEADARALLHELQVHQIELEMQNDELQRAQAVAQEASEKYCDLFDFAPVAYFQWDMTGRILELNLAGATLLGLDRFIAKRMWFEQFIVERHRNTFAEFLEWILKNETKQTCEVELERDGSSICVLIEGIADRNRGGPPVVCRAAVIDISQKKRADSLVRTNEALMAEMAARKQAEELAEHAKAIAEQANRAKDHFLAVLSHELRTPLTPVVMGVSILLNRSDLDPAAREILDLVQRNVAIQIALIDDLLDMARITRGTIAITKRPVEICDIIQRAIEVCKFNIEAKRFEFQVDIEGCSSCFVEADAARLQQVFWNLLKNAIKFTPHGGKLRVHGHASERHVTVEVSDSGIGILPESLSRIFSDFEQADQSVARQFGGLGLGLSISKTLVELHGGKIWANSDGIDKGTTVCVQFPIIVPSDHPQEKTPESLQPAEVDSLRILLVEDHQFTSKVMRMLLAREGHTIETAASAATALALAESQAFDVLISDLGLPDGSGHELLRELRRRGHHFPGIALSGYGQADDIDRSREAGFTTHLIKPATREMLLAAVASAVAQKPEGSQ